MKNRKTIRCSEKKKSNGLRPVLRVFGVPGLRKIKNSVLQVKTAANAHSCLRQMASDKCIEKSGDNWRPWKDVSGAKEAGPKCGRLARLPG